MRIKSIRLSNNYKRFHDLTIDLGNNPKKIIALVGPNGSGKSSVFDGMLFLNNIHQQIGQMGQKDNKFHSMTGATIDHNAIHIVFSDGRSYAEARSNRMGGEKQNTIFSFRSSHRHSSTLNVTKLQSISDIKSNIIGASSSADIDNRIEQNYQRLYSHIDKINKKEGSKLTYSQVKEQVLGELNRILSSCLNLEITDHGNILDGEGTLFFKKSDQIEPFNFNVLSSGEKEAIDILLDLYLRKEVYTETVFLIDEPELHLNTKIQKNLLIELEKLIPENCQLWIATHSIGFLSTLQNELRAKSDVIHFIGNHVQEVTTLTPIKKTRREWQEIFSTALEDLTGLFAPKTIVYCEGKPEPTDTGEEDGIDAKIYNKVFETEKPDTLFISSGGHTVPDKHASLALKVLGKAFSGVGLLLLKDKDIHFDGKKTTDEDRLTFLNKNPSHRMLNRKEIEDYLFDYELVTKVYGVSQSAYNSIFIGAVDSKTKTGDLMKLCGSNTGMDKNALRNYFSR